MSDLKLLNCVEAGAYVRRLPNYLAKLRCAGAGPRYVKMGRTVLYDAADLDAWLDSLKVGSTFETKEGG